MNFKLKRSQSSLYGVFGSLVSDDEQFKFSTLEHAFLLPQCNEFFPKVAAGLYTCKRGTHLLEPTERHPAPKPFDAFEVQNVPNFAGQKVTKILIHVGNYNKDSDGCILIGNAIQASCLIESQAAFDRFMELQDGVDAFTLFIE